MIIAINQSINQSINHYWWKRGWDILSKRECPTSRKKAGELLDSLPVRQ